MRALITGASGFVGRRLLKYLGDRGHEAIGVVRGPTVLANAICWDFSDGPPPSYLPTHLDAVIHAAQSRNYKTFPADAGEMFLVNTASTQMLLDYAVKAGATRFCLLSSGTVYEPYDCELIEGAALSPRSMLGATKLAAEVVAAPYSSTFSVATLRIFTPYGPGQEMRLIPNLISRVQHNQPIQVSANGEGMRLAPIYIDDLCQIIATAVETGWQSTVNVASPTATTIRGLADTIGKQLNKSPRYEVVAGQPVDLAPSVAKLSELFETESLLPLNEGIQRTLQT